MADDSKKVEEDEKNDQKSTEETTTTVTTAISEEDLICLDDSPSSSVASAPSGDELYGLPLLLFTTLANRYNLIDCLESLKPKYLILYHSDIASTRVIECFAAHHKLHSIKLFGLSYTNSTEEERYLISIQNEQMAMETLLKDQEVCFGFWLDTNELL